MEPVTEGDATGNAETDEVVRLPARARVVRLVIAFAILALTLAGTVFGNDYAFPFGPPRMYASRADPDSPVSSTRVVGLDDDGEEVLLSGGEVGLRRAEFEGQLPRLIDHPGLLALLALNYEADHPDEDPLVAVAIIVRRYELDDGVSTGVFVEDVLLTYDLHAEPQGST